MGISLLSISHRIAPLEIRQLFAFPQETQVESLGWKDSLEESLATHSSILTWEIP